MEEYDFHGWTTKEVLQFLRNLETDHIATPIIYHFITGRGNHTKKRPQMDYAAAKDWKCPLMQTVYEYLVYEKRQGARITVYPASILWRPPTNPQALSSLKNHQSNSG